MKIYVRLILVFALYAGGQVHAGDSVTEPGVIHMVVIWLKEPGNAQHRQQVISSTKKLKEIPEVLDLRVGEVIPSDRPVVDSSYDVALYLRFAGKEELKRYLVHPIHKALVKEELAPVLDHYRVFDFTDE